MVTCQYNMVLSMKAKNLQNTSAPYSQWGAKKSEVAALFVAYVEGKLQWKTGFKLSRVDRLIPWALYVLHFWAQYRIFFSCLAGKHCLQIFLLPQKHILNPLNFLLCLVSPCYIWVGATEAWVTFSFKRVTSSWTVQLWNCYFINLSFCK